MCRIISFLKTMKDYDERKFKKNEKRNSLPLKYFNLKENSETDQQLLLRSSRRSSNNSSSDESTRRIFDFFCIPYLWPLCRKKKSYTEVIVVKENIVFVDLPQ